jgi:DNA-binding NtrC family response regulator
VGETLLRLGGWVEAVDSFEKLRGAIENHSVDLLFVSCTQARPLLTWLNDFRSEWKGRPVPPVLTLASGLDVDLYLEAMSLGAYDCVGLPVEEGELVRLVNKAVEKKRLVLRS